MRKAMTWMRNGTSLTQITLVMVTLIGLGFSVSVASRFIVGPEAKDSGGGVAQLEEVSVSVAAPGRAKRKGTRQIVAEPTAANKQLTPLYEAYLDASRALSRDDLGGAQKAFRRLVEAVGGVGAAALSGEQPKRWQSASAVLLPAAAKALAAEDRAGFRLHYQDVSGAMLSLAKTFGHALDAPLYKVHCPMAFDDQGAA